MEVLQGSTFAFPDDFWSLGGPTRSQNHYESVRRRIFVPLVVSFELMICEPSFPVKLLALFASIIPCKSSEVPKASVGPWRRNGAFECVQRAFVPTSSCFIAATRVLFLLFVASFLSLVSAQPGARKCKSVQMAPSGASVALSVSLSRMHPTRSL